jgi:hypothetical protein
MLKRKKKLKTDIGSKIETTQALVDFEPTEILSQETMSKIEELPISEP